MVMKLWAEWHAWAVAVRGDKSDQLAVSSWVLLSLHMLCAPTDKY